MGNLGLFFFILIFSTVNMYIINFNNDWIQAADLYYWKQPLCQLSLHRCLKEKEFGNEKERERKFKNSMNQPWFIIFLLSVVKLMRKRFSI